MSTDAQGAWFMLGSQAMAKRDERPGDEGEARRDPSMEAMCTAARSALGGGAVLVVGWSDARERPRVLGASGTGAREGERARRMLAPASQARRALEAGREVTEDGWRWRPVTLGRRAVGALGLGGVDAGDIAPWLVLAARLFAQRAEQGALTDARKALGRAKQEVARLENAMTRAAHDLKAPLVPMKGYVDMMLRGMGGATAPGVQRYLERLRQAVDRQAELIEQTVRSPVRRGSADLRAALDAACSRARSAPAHRRVSWSAELEDAPSRCLVHAREREVEAVCRGLLRAVAQSARSEEAVRIGLRAEEEGFVISVRARRPLRPGSTALPIAEERLRRMGGHLRLPDDHDVAIEAWLPADASAARHASSSESTRQLYRPVAVARP